ncbi:MAG: glycosyltransferase family 2 protein [Pirellulales bacterium]
MRASLTVLIPCKNERKNIQACIDSVRDIADEVVVADSGSTDGTLDVVRKIGGCRIIEREYVHSANFKNWAIPQCTHSWVLIVDADERVTPQLAAEIRQVLASPPEDVDGYWIGRKNHFLGYHIAHCGWNSDDVLRLFRRDVGRYRERWVHAEIELPRQRVRRLKHPFDHFTAWHSEQHWHKLNRYATWGALNMRDEGQRVTLFSMCFRAPLRFLQLYFLRLGFLDGMPGFHVCAYTAFYVFMKQARLWELAHAIPQPDPDADQSGVAPSGALLRFPAATAADDERRRHARAA